MLSSLLLCCVVSHPALFSFTLVVTGRYPKIENDVVICVDSEGVV